MTDPQERESARDLLRRLDFEGRFWRMIRDAIDAQLERGTIAGDPAYISVARNTAELFEEASAALRAAPSAPTREQVEALRDSTPADRWEEGWNAAIDRVLSLYPVPAKQNH